MKIQQIIILFIVLSFYRTGLAKEFTLANLQAEDFLEIRFQSTGCFHKEKVRIKITRTNKYMAEVSKEESFDPIIVELSSAEIKELDELFSYYRTIKKPGGCTTEDSISLLWSGTRIKPFIEPFKDATCKAPEQGYGVIKNLLDLFKKKKHKEGYERTGR